MGNTNDSLLNPGEKKLLLLLSEGLTKTDAAAKMNVSKFTADGHLRNVFEKLGVHTTVAAVAEALRRREIP